MRYLDLTLPDIAANLALDEALLLQAEAGVSGEVMRVWEWAGRAVVLGSACRLAEEVNEGACRTDGVPVLRRSSGGGTVLLGPGCLLFTLVLDHEANPALGEIRPSYRFILNRISQALAGLLPRIGCKGISDLVAGDRKFSGNAQQRKRRFLLHHGTLLYGFNMEAVSRYLRSPPRQPEYRGGREHCEFLCNLPTTGDELKQRLREAWDAQPAGEHWPQEEVGRLVTEKYATDAWNKRR